MSAPLVIALEDLLEAMELGGRDIGFFLDCESGEFLSFTSDDPDDVLYVARDAPDRYFEILPPPPRAAFGWMVEYAEQQRTSLSGRLLSVLDRPKPFKGFKTALIRFALIDEWYAFEKKRLEEYARAWAGEAGLVVAEPKD